MQRTGARTRWFNAQQIRFSSNLLGAREHFRALFRRSPPRIELSVQISILTANLPANSPLLLLVPPPRLFSINDPRSQYPSSLREFFSLPDRPESCSFDCLTRDYASVVSLRFSNFLTRIQGCGQERERKKKERKEKVGGIYFLCPDNAAIFFFTPDRVIDSVHYYQSKLHDRMTCGSLLVFHGLNCRYRWSNRKELILSGAKFLREKILFDLFIERKRFFQSARTRKEGMRG